MNDLTVVTCRSKIPDPVSQPYYVYPQWLASLARYNVAPLVLDGAGWGGLGWNAILPKQALDTGHIKSDFTLFTNCYDVLFTVSPNDILQRFLDIQTHGQGTPSIIFGAEKQCFPESDLVHQDSPTSYRFLNSGWYIGVTEAIHEALKEMDPEKNILDDYRGEDGKMVEDNDQIWWQRQMLNGSIPIGLDYDTELVQNFHGVTPGEMEWRDGKLFNKETGNAPMVWHLNGGSSSRWKDKLLGYLGL